MMSDWIKQPFWEPRLSVSMFYQKVVSHQTNINSDAKGHIGLHVVSTEDDNFRPIC